MQPISNNAAVAESSLLKKVDRFLLEIGGSMSSGQKILVALILLTTPLCVFFVTEISVYFELRHLVAGASAITAMLSGILVLYYLSTLGIMNYHNRSIRKLNQENQQLRDVTQIHRQLSEEYLEIISEISSCSNWKLASYRTASLLIKPMSRNGKRVTVNILSVKADDLYFDASSTSAGQELVNDHFHFSIDQGITGWVVRHGKCCLVNDLNDDTEKRFFSHPAFPDIKSEMCAPIKYGNNKIIGVLDIQGTAPFEDDDMLILQTLGGQLGEIYQRLESMEVRRKLAELSISLAKRVISIRDLGTLLIEIGVVAKEVLGADVISYYYINPLDSQLKGPYTSGELLHPEVTKSADDTLTDEYLNHILSNNSVQYFEQAEDNLSYRPNDNQRLPFGPRENIKSFAVIPLLSQNGTIGLMFVNFRTHQSFEYELKSLIEIFSSLSSLAIQNCQAEEITALVRHDQLVRDLHDTVQHRLLGTERALKDMLNSGGKNGNWKSSGTAALNYLVSARKIIYNLERGEDIFSLKTILENIRWHAQLIETIYKINVILKLPEINTGVPIITWMGNQIEYVVEEVVYNAVRHSQTKKLEITVELTGNELSIRIKDFGIGFTNDQIERGLGLDNIQQRVETYLNGSLVINSEPGKGTEALVRFPVIIEFPEAL